MAHGGYGKRTPTAGSIQQPSKGLGVDKKFNPKVKVKVKANAKVKLRSASFKNQIRSVERLLQKDIPLEVREAQMKKLEELKKQQDTHNQLSVDIEQKKKKLSADKKIFLRYKMVKFLERRKIDRRIKHLEKSQLDSSDSPHEAMIAEQLLKLKEDLEYVRFFPKTEKYVSLFMGGDNTDIAEKRNIFREQIKANIAAAAASGMNLEETGGEDDGILDVSDDDFFLNGSSSDEADADDELKTKSTREQAPNASRKPTASGLSSGKRNHKEISARTVMPPTRPTSSSFSNSARAGKPPPRPTSGSFSNSARAGMPPPRPTSSSFSNSSNGKSNFGGFSSKKPVGHGAEFSAPRYTSNSRNGPSFGNKAAASEFSAPSYTSNNRNGPSFGNRAAASEFTAPSYTSNNRNGPSFRNTAAALDVRAVGLSSGNISSSSEVRKPRRKRRAKKKKQE